MKRSNFEVTRLIQYAKKATAEELMEDYGIELLESGEVFDTIEDHVFATLLDWAEDVVGVEEDEYEYGNRKPSKYEEDFF